MPTKQVKEERIAPASIEQRLDAIADAIRAIVPELESRAKDATKSCQHQRHAFLHRLHRSAHDFLIVASEHRV